MGKDYITSKYNFIDLNTRSVHRHIADGNTTTLDQYFDYDHRGRLVKNRISINGGAEVLMTANVYNEAGTLVDHYQHSESGGNFLQRIDYDYNIRGWLTKIDDPVTFAENDKFGLQLFYNTAPTGGLALYNGNISGMKWGTARYNDCLYKFTYDGNNRLTNADFDKSGIYDPVFNELYSYDANGNILGLTRFGDTSMPIDYLSYTYIGNRINVITDGLGDIPLVEDYPGTPTSTSSFGYDYNGNMYWEPNKAISISYNFLNLPKELNFGSNKKINYFYTFDAEKQRQTVENNGTLTKTDYCGPFVYETASGVRSLKFIITSEGRAVKSGANWDLEYNLKDHLGNIRTVIHKGTNGLAEVVQEKHYYAFGLEMSSLSRGSSTNKYQYNGKEYQNDFGLGWYDYGARFYDPAIGRWHSVDALYEKYYSFSPYNYVGNNPIYRIDPNGMEWKTKKDEDLAKNITGQLNTIEKGLSSQKSRLKGRIDKINSNTKLSEAQKSKKTEGLNDQLTEVQNTLGNVQSAGKEIAQLGTSETKYTFNNLGEGSQVGNVSSELDGTIVINHTGDFGNQVHELKHASQIDNNLIEPVLGTDQNRFTKLSSGQSEVQAYERQYSVGSPMPPSDGGTVRGWFSITTGYVSGIYYYDNKTGKKVYPYIRK